MGHLMGASLGISHKGKSLGLVKQVIEDDEDPDATRNYHANKEANQMQAKALAMAVMGGAADVSHKSASLGRYLKKKIEEED